MYIVISLVMEEGGIGDVRLLVEQGRARVEVHDHGPLRRRVERAERRGRGRAGGRRRGRRTAPVRCSPPLRLRRHGQRERLPRPEGFDDPTWPFYSTTISASVTPAARARSSAASASATDANGPAMHAVTRRPPPSDGLDLHIQRRRALLLPDLHTSPARTGPPRATAARAAARLARRSPATAPAPPARCSADRRPRAVAPTRLGREPTARRPAAAPSSRPPRPRAARP